MGAASRAGRSPANSRNSLVPTCWWSVGNRPDQQKVESSPKSSFSTRSVAARYPVRIRGFSYVWRRSGN